MSQYILLNRIQVQGANAIAGFTWGFPAITHFLGYTHNLHRKLNPGGSSEKPFPNIDVSILGCAVIAHHHQVHTYGYNQFLQSKNPPYQFKEDNKYKTGSPPVIEEGKMNLTVSLLVKYDGYVGGSNQHELCRWLSKVCRRQRLAGGIVLDIQGIDFFTIKNGDDTDNLQSLRLLIRKLLPGFVLRDQSEHLEKHIKRLKKENEETEPFDAWLDFISLKQKARPASNLINQHLIKLSESQPDIYQTLLKQWQEHLAAAYDPNTITENLKEYFSSLPENKTIKKLLQQWKEYCYPTETTDAIWEYIKKPESGFLVPIMVGYKAISQVYKNNQVRATRDDKTDVCFVEAVHSVGEWQGVHRIKDNHELNRTFWMYDFSENWYLCKQSEIESQREEFPAFDEFAEDDFS